MVLLMEDAKLFYELFFPLLNFVNEKHKINTEIGEIYFGKRISPDNAKEIAGCLWENTGLIDEYLSKKNLSEEQEEIISSWKKRITGKFVSKRQIIRTLTNNNGLLQPQVLYSITTKGKRPPTSKVPKNIKNSRTKSTAQNKIKSNNEYSHFS